MTAPLRERSVASLRASLVTWTARLAARRQRLAAWSKIRTSRTPRTRITPERKIAAVRALRISVADAEDAIEVVKAALAWKRLALRGRALSIAREYLGVLERGGNNRGEDVEAIIRANGGVPGEAWCADFVAVVYRRAGSGAVMRAWAAVRNLGFLAGMRVLSGVRSALAGDIVCFVFDHTGLLIGYCDARGRSMPARTATHVHTIEGNTGTGGSVSDSRAGGDGVHERIRPIGQVARMVRVTR